MVMKYVKDFEFPSDKGFTGSAGKMPMRGVGAVTNAEAAQVRRKKLVGAPSLADLKALGAAKAAARMSPAERNQIDAAMANRAMTGVLGKGYGAMTNAERFLSGREKLKGMGSSTKLKGMGSSTELKGMGSSTKLKGMGSSTKLKGVGSPTASEVGRAASKMDPNVMGEGVGPLSGRKLGGYTKGGKVRGK